MPDFRGRLDLALERLAGSLPDVLNHNLETVPRLYAQARPGADYSHSLRLLREFKSRYPDIPTKSGLMVGLGETDEEILAVMRDLRRHDVDMLTIGQYLQPTEHHLPVLRYVDPDGFARFERAAQRDGLCSRRLRPDGAFQLSRRSAGARGRGRLIRDSRHPAKLCKEKLL